MPETPSRSGRREVGRETLELDSSSVEFCAASQLTLGVDGMDSEEDAREQCVVWLEASDGRADSREKNRRDGV